jgi:hypothetical protein
MKDTDADFENLINANAQYEGDRLLDKQLQGVREWIEQKEALGEKPTLRALTRQMILEPAHRQRATTLVLLAAALWRLLKKEDEE